MTIHPPGDATLAGALRAIRSGERSVSDVLEGCLVAIRSHEGDLSAWAFVDEAQARAEAAWLDRELQAGRGVDPLMGVPIGVKEIFQVEGMPVAVGVPEARGPAAERDSAYIAELRGRGALILGQTVATPYAWIDPPPTANPWAADRTPGGSSSGSAAAVAAGMCLGAVGSQTGGSVTRPAAFCGLCGFKPTYGRRPLDGVLPLAKSLDHPGLIARTVVDLAILDGQSVAKAERPPRIGRLRELFEARAEPVMNAALEAALETLARVGASVSDAAPPDRLEEFPHHHKTILAAEAAEFHAPRRAKRPDHYPEKITALIEEGLEIRAVDYLKAREYQSQLRAAFEARFDSEAVDVWATPAALGAAPGRESTGSPLFNAPWSLTGLPTVSLPIALDADGLPLAIQLAGRPGANGEAELFRAALWIEDALRKAAGAEPLNRPALSQRVLDTAMERLER